MNSCLSYSWLKLTSFWRWFWSCILVCLVWKTLCCDLVSWPKLRSQKQANGGLLGTFWSCFFHGPGFNVPFWTVQILSKVEVKTCNLLSTSMTRFNRSSFSSFSAIFLARPAQPRQPRLVSSCEDGVHWRRQPLLAAELMDYASCRPWRLWSASRSLWAIPVSRHHLLALVRFGQVNRWMQLNVCDLRTDRTLYTVSAVKIDKMSIAKTCNALSLPVILSSIVQQTLERKSYLVVLVSLTGEWAFHIHGILVILVKHFSTCLCS